MSRFRKPIRVVEVPGRPGWGGLWQIINEDSESYKVKNLDTGEVAGIWKALTRVTLASKKAEIKLKDALRTQNAQIGLKKRK